MSFLAQTLIRPHFSFLSFSLPPFLNEHFYLLFIFLQLSQRIYRFLFNIFIFVNRLSVQALKYYLSRQYPLSIPLFQLHFLSFRFFSSRRRSLFYIIIFAILFLNLVL